MPFAFPLVAIDVLLVVLWTIACVLAIVLIMNKLASVIAGIPGVGGWAANGVKSMAQAITNACGHLMSGIEGMVGAGLHLFADYLHGMLSQFVAHAALIAHLAELVGKQIYSVTGLRALVHRLEKVWHGIEAGVRTLTREWHGIERRVKAIERSIAKGIGHDLRITVKALDRELHTVVEPEIRAIERADATAAAAIDNLYEWAKGKASLLGIGTFAYAISVALGIEAWNLLRCSVFKNFWNSRGCGLWSGLEDLLGLFVDTILLTNICELIPLMEAAISDVADPIVITLTDVGAGLCSGGIGAPPTLQVPALSLPAAPGVTLNLP